LAKNYAKINAIQILDLWKETVKVVPAGWGLTTEMNENGLEVILKIGI